MVIILKTSFERGCTRREIAAALVEKSIDVTAKRRLFAWFSNNSLFFLCNSVCHQSHCFRLIFDLSSQLAINTVALPTIPSIENNPRKTWLVDKYKRYADGSSIIWARGWFVVGNGSRADRKLELFAVGSARSWIRGSRCTTTRVVFAIGLGLAAGTLPRDHDYSDPASSLGDLFSARTNSIEVCSGES